MPSFYANTVNELVKLLARRKTIVFLVLTALIPIIAAAAASRLQFGFGVAALTSADFPVVLLGFYTAVYLPLLLFMTASDMFAGEAGDKTMKLLLTRPITRFQAFASKLAAMLGYTALLLAIALVVSVASLLFLGGAGTVVQGLGRTAAAYVTALLPLFTLGLAAAFIAQFFKNGSGALTVCILLYALAKLGAYFVPALAVYTPAAYTDWHMLWLGASVASGKILNVFMFLAACCILFFTGGYTLFERKQY